MTLNNALRILLEDRETYGGLLEIVHNEMRPFEAERPRLRVRDCGLELEFDSVTQSLCLITLSELHWTTPVTFGSSRFEPGTLTTKAVQDLFGAVRPGTYDHGAREYTLQYSGISYVFAINPDDWDPNIHEGPHARLPITSRVGAHFRAKRLSISEPRSARPAAPSPAAGAASTASAAAGTGAERIRVVPRRGLVLRSGEPLYLGTSYQTTIALLGAPDETVYKFDEGLVHSVTAGALRKSADARTLCGDFLASYRRLGLDIVFGGVSTKAKKFVLHTNLIGHYDFTVYDRALFEIVLDHGAALSSESSWAEIVAATGDEGVSCAICRGADDASLCASEYRGLVDLGLIFELSPVSCIIASLTVFLP
eukprot:a509796_52.p1 GENE.a509796_52~~a509796_52.p1  ORF type:complete len:393 (+),score=82.63 a509796_52:80-1180(+)